MRPTPIDVLRNAHDKARLERYALIAWQALLGSAYSDCRQYPALGADQAVRHARAMISALDRANVR